LPLLYTPTMLFGFFGQLNPVQYPSSWRLANEVLKREKKCKAIFLPWHHYYSLSFNKKILTANTAPLFFNCDILISSNAEIGDVGYSRDSMTQDYNEIANAITNNNGDPDKIIRS